MKGYHLVRPGKADEGGPNGFSYVLIKLVGHDPPDVVGLEDLVQVAHFGSAQCSRPVGIPGPNLSVTETGQYEGRGQINRAGRWARSAGRAGDPGGLPRCPGPPAPLARGGRHWTWRSRGADRPSAGQSGTGRRPPSAPGARSRSPQGRRRAPAP